MKMVRVWWHDAHTVASEWMDLAEIESDPCLCVSVGFLVPNAKPGHVVLVLNTAHDYAFGGDGVAIPNEMVQSVEELQVMGDSWKRKARRWWSSLRRS